MPYFLGNWFPLYFFIPPGLILLLYFCISFSCLIVFSYPSLVIQVSPFHLLRFQSKQRSDGNSNQRAQGSKGGTHKLATTRVFHQKCFYTWSHVSRIMTSSVARSICEKSPGTSSTWKLISTQLLFGKKTI